MWMMRTSTAALDRMKTFKSNIKPVCFRPQVKCRQMRVGLVSPPNGSRRRFPAVLELGPDKQCPAWAKIPPKNISPINTVKREQRLLRNGLV